MTVETINEFTEDEREYIVEQLGPGGIASLAALTDEEKIAECRRILAEKEDSP